MNLEVRFYFDLKTNLSVKNIMKQALNVNITLAEHILINKTR